MNRVCIVGRLTRDLELRTATKNDAKFVFFTVAVSEYGSNGEERTNFIPCSAFNKLAENMAKYLSKGSLISLEGRVTTRSNKTLDGRIETIVNITADRVSFLEPAKNNVNKNSYDFDSTISNEFDTNDSVQASNSSEEVQGQNQSDDDFSILWE
ncbi:single-stranded DNA-binding protein [Mycoplasma putrefaciens]|uniref:single-stranded DNA-binding protein n=1 Tax=Mycoplasma putrefaciens TaxID=2123 RepID=UPI003DA3C8A0